MKELNKFIYIFEGLDIAHGITKKSSEVNEKGKNETKSFTIHKPPIEKLWLDHLEGKDPGLGIIPINRDNKLNTLNKSILNLNNKTNKAMKTIKMFKKQKNFEFLYEKK